MNANIFGCFAEYKFATMAMEQGYFVSMPLLHTSPYDCIVETPKGLFKVQIKAINESNSLRNRVFLKGRNNKMYDKKDVDFFAIYSKEREGFFIFKNELKFKSFNLDSEVYSKYFNNFASM